jgi:hypothetical protein
MVHVLSKERLGKHVTEARRIVGGVVFYTVRVVSKERRRLVLPRTSFLLLGFVPFFSWFK